MHELSRREVEHLGRRGSAHSSQTRARILDSFDLAVSPEDQSLTPCLIRDGYWESWITSWFTKNVQTGMTVIDVGANCGYYTMLSQVLVGRGGHVIAYEPNPLYLDLLRSTKLINQARFSIRDVGLSDHTGRSVLYIPDDLYGSASLVCNYFGAQYNVTEINVPITTLDIESDALCYGHIDVIKMDAEGWEEHIFDGATETLSRTDTLVIEWVPASHSERFYGKLSEWGKATILDTDGNERESRQNEILFSTDWIMLVVRRHK